jgi:hypothetical protein
VKWRFGFNQSARSRYDLVVADVTLRSSVAKPIELRLDLRSLAVEIIGAGRQAKAPAQLIDVIQEPVDQGTKPCALLTLLRC